MDEKNKPYSEMKRQDLNLLCKKQAEEIDLLKSQLQKAKHLLSVAFDDDSVIRKTTSNTTLN
jgi:hypothetical protein